VLDCGWNNNFAIYFNHLILIMSLVEVNQAIEAWLCKYNFIIYVIIGDRRTENRDVDVKCWRHSKHFISVCWNVRRIGLTKKGWAILYLHSSSYDPESWQWSCIVALSITATACCCLFVFKWPAVFQLWEEGSYSKMVSMVLLFLLVTLTLPPKIVWAQYQAICHVWCALVQ